MKLLRNSFLLLASLLLFPLLASAQTGPYVLMGNGSGSNGTVTVDGYALQVTYDLTVTTSHGVSSATLSNIFTNSNCADDNSAMNGTATVSEEGSITSLTFTADNSSGTSGTLKVTISNGHLSISTQSGCAAGSSTSSGSTSFTNVLQTTSNNGVPQTGNCFFFPFDGPCVYYGDLDGNNGTNNGDDTHILTAINFNITPSFSLDGTTVQVLASVCPAGPKTMNLTVTDAAAAEAAIGTNNESGNVLIFAATDGTNTIGFIATPTGVDGNTSPNNGQWYITYYVTGGACNGSNGGDAPFALKAAQTERPAPPRRMPIRFGGLALRTF